MCQITTVIITCFVFSTIKCRVHYLLLDQRQVIHLLSVLHTSRCHRFASQTGKKEHRRGLNRIRPTIQSLLSSLKLLVFRCFRFHFAKLVQRGWKHTPIIHSAAHPLS